MFSALSRFLRISPRNNQPAVRSHVPADLERLAAAYADAKRRGDTRDMGRAYKRLKAAREAILEQGARG